MALVNEDSPRSKLPAQPLGALDDALTAPRAPESCGAEPKSQAGATAGEVALDEVTLDELGAVKAIPGEAIPGEAIPGEAIPGEATPREATPGPAVRRSPLIGEFAVIAFLGWIYDWLQNLAPLRRATAMANAKAILSFETRLGIAPERSLDHWLSHHHVLAYISSDFYDNAIFGVTLALAALVWWRRPDLYRRLRNDLVLANLGGFAIFWLFPVAPPRMLPGFIDVVEKVGGLGSWHNLLISHADQLAAMPSMHIAWAVWCSLALWRLARQAPGGAAGPVGSAGAAGPVVGAVAPVGGAAGLYRPSLGSRLAMGAAIAYPIVTSLVVMATANHYLADVLAGFACIACSALAVEVALPAAWRHRRRRLPAVVHVP